MELSPVLSVYKKRSKYTTQIHDCKPKTAVDFGQLVEFEIPRYGDLIKTMFIKMILPPTFSYFIYTGSPGLHIFEYIELIIGDTVIERLDGYAMSMYFLTHYDMVYSGTTDICLGGNPDQLCEFMPANGFVGQTTETCYTTDRNRTIFYPIPFYFLNKPSLSIPLCILHKQEVKIRLKFRPWQDMLIRTVEYAYNKKYTETPTKLVIPETNPLKLVDFSVPVEFVYITEEDYKTIASKPSNQYIHQTQLQRIPVSNSVNSVETRLEFTNPVKCFYFFTRYDNTTDMIYRNLYNERKNKSRLLNGRAWAQHIESIQIELDNEVYLSNSVANYMFLTAIQRNLHDCTYFHNGNMDRFRTAIGNMPTFTLPFTGTLWYDTPPLGLYWKVLAGPIYMYSFALDPSSEIPCGAINFSAVRHPYITFNMFSAGNQDRTVYLYAQSVNVLQFLPKQGNARLLMNNPLLKK